MVVSLSVKVFALCASVLYAKVALTVSIQGGKTFAAGNRPPEDAKLSLAKRFPGIKQTYGAVPTEEELENKRLVRAREAEYRWKRIVMNDLENIPMGLIVFGAGVLVEASEKVHIGAMLVFTLARLLHTYVYAYSMQPHRGLTWMIAIFAVFVGIVNTVATGVLGN
uniref:Microsomal glutathione S-transferase 1 n=1 Tax=Globisporangium ultimum (strain ATCC 200006 / CBS 805.95 / DAOM BR144) TaxID=431595 RepID=K3WS41_GLOUD